MIAGIWLFAELMDALEEPEVQSIDQRVVLIFRNPTDLSDPVGPKWLEVLMRDLTALGGTGVLSLLVLATCGFLAIQRKRHSLLLTASAAIGGGMISQTLKGWIERPRPSIVPHLTHVDSASFPSGHSMNSAVVYLTLGALLASLAKERRLKIYLVTVVLILTFLVGLSRVYLGVHYPTDVLAGWCIGLVWAILCWTVSDKLRRRGTVKKGLSESD